MNFQESKTCYVKNRLSGATREHRLGHPPTPSYNFHFWSMNIQEKRLHSNQNIWAPCEEIAVGPRCDGTDRARQKGSQSVSPKTRGPAHVASPTHN